jgi:hypothetical protein
MLRNDSLIDTAFLFYMRSKGQTAYYIRNIAFVALYLQEIESADLNQTCTFIFTITSKIIKNTIFIKTNKYFAYDF